MARNGAQHRKKEPDKRTKSLFDKYEKKAKSEKLKRVTIVNTLSAIMQFKDFLGSKGLDEVSTDDIDAFLESKDVIKRKESSQNTLKIRLRSFYKHLSDDGEVPDFLTHLKTNIKNNASPVKRKNLLSEDDVLAMMNVCKSSMERALISTLYESACRRAEILGLTIEDVEFDDKGVVIQVNGKTGERIIRLVHSEPILREWLNHHPKRNDSNAKVFPLWANQMFAVVKRVAKDSQVKKRVWIHLFRHSRLTALAQHLTESELRVFAGWSKNSSMAGVYVHLNGHDLTNKLVSIAKSGKAEEQTITKPSPLKPVMCPRCQQENPPASMYCNCGMLLSVKESVKESVDKTGMESLVRELVAKFTDDDDFRSSVRSALDIADSFRNNTGEEIAENSDNQ